MVESAQFPMHPFDDLLLIVEALSNLALLGLEVLLEELLDLLLWP